MSPPWPTVRAGLLLLVIGAHLLVALPIGPRVTRSSLKSDVGQSEVDVWMRLAGPLGFTRQGFEETVLTWSDRLVTTDEMITAPVRAVLRVFRQGQSWGLFAGTDRTPQRIEVRGKTADGAEVLLYRRLDPEHDFLRPWLDFRRVRGVYDLSGKSVPPRYKNFCSWVADRAFAAYPELVEVTVTQVQIEVRLPSEPPDPRTKDMYTQVRTRHSVDTP